ncbi:GNAT family N-acetyltransferase [Paenibacillus hemerocallicola]|uniref:GNAT family N-acetyltransferase n=1 Tax=Paenibacillus hemerocallicola TaxID=1172614 RepID=A0A5C4THG0_9BACL|nr:GNAT family N-acetyltransferase [Paenibacillus hemerocallicola]TNJ68007.1 GNAT family N-acetyltransferase [Paenibacillus hemerocallicola]
MGTLTDCSIALYDRESIGTFAWPQTEDGLYARSYLLPLLERHSETFVANVRTRLYVLAVDDLVLPVTVNEREYDNSYVCSPYTHYVSYAKEELVLLRSRPIRKLLAGMLDGIGLLLRGGQINRAVQVNNWLLSTNLYPRLESRQLEAIVSFLRGRFPQHAVLFRSLDGATNAPLLETLSGMGGTMVPSRQIYVLEPDRMNAKARWLVKRDFALLGKHGYEIVGPDGLTEHDAPRIVELYNALYLEKYSLHNPHFSVELIRLALLEGMLQLHALRREGRIDAVLGYYRRGGIMTTPLFGYDTTLPQETGLYRMLSAVLIGIAARNGLLLHESSGAARFKRNRGAVADIEYMAVFDKHLPARRRWGWNVLASVLRRIGIPIMRKYKL